MGDRLALLRAILAAPDEDTPRLAFADWLDEHGTTDADRARVEFIRLGCRMKAGKRPIQKAESEWLAANWKRLVPNTVALCTRPDWFSVGWKGRFLELWVGWGDDRLHLAWLHLEFARGAVQAIRFKEQKGYDRFRVAAAADEPLAVLGPVDLPRVSERAMRRTTVVVYPEDWGEDVFARLAGFDECLPGRWKQYTTRPHRDRDPRERWDPQHLARQAVSDAMTAIAREANGLTATDTAGTG